jgi:c-di-GMP-binding flagellar brake protein YcgR
MADNERREFYRVEVVAPVRFRLIEEKTAKPLTDWVHGTTADIGLGGVKMLASMTKTQAEMLVDKYVSIELSFQLPGTPTVVEATGAIAYFMLLAAASKSSTVSFGVSFVSIDSNAEDVIGGFIRQRVDAHA